jgi:hypothetical protein
MLRPTVSRPVSLGIKHPSGAYDQNFITVRLRVCWCGALSLTRGRVCRLQLLLALASAVILGSEPIGTRDLILLSQIWDFPFRRLLRLAGSLWRYSTPPPHGTNLGLGLSLSLMLRPRVSRPVCLGIMHPSRAYDQIFISVQNTEYVWQLRSWFRGSPSLTRGRVCLLYVPLALASAVFSGPSPLGLATVFYCLSSETFLFVASYDTQGHGGGIRLRLHTGLSPLSLAVCTYPAVPSATCNFHVVLETDVRGKC